MQIAYIYANKVLARRCRPVLCGVTTGLHWMPQVGDRVWVANVEEAVPVALCGLSLFDETGTSTLIPNLVPLLAGETAILGPTGDVMKWVQTGGITINTRKIVTDGDTVTGTITAPSGGGSCTFTLTVHAGNPGD